ncbi:MAG: bifunctional homocysteine S-methyltransferase/methylenetetrahydrofolate reductase [Pseudobdellovibrionaceae bacterium]
MTDKNSAKDIHTKKSLADALASDGVMVMDGAMATALYDAGFYINRSFEELSVIEPQAVGDVVKSFKKSGAKIFHTNTFGASIPKLTKYGIQDQLESIIKSAVQVSRDIVGEDGYVLGLIGPLGLLIEPLGPTGVDEAEVLFKKNIQIFADLDVDGIAINGLHDLNELRTALIAAKNFDKPIFVSIGLQENLKTSQGYTIQEFVELAEEFNVAAIGICGEIGPSGMLTALEQLRPLTFKPIYILPNAGLPRYINDQYIYLCSPDYMGKFAKRYIQAGANLIGGHCGVYETHIKAISNAIKMNQSMVQDLPAAGGNTSSLGTSGSSNPLTAAAVRGVHATPVAAQKVSDIAERSLLGKRLANKEKIISVEVVPPFISGFDKFSDCCQQLQDGGIEFINIPDGARAVSRISSLQLSSYVQSKFKLEPIPHLTCRDRNLIGLQSDILGTYVNGVRNILLVTGDPPKLGNNPGATAVYDVDAIGLTHIVHRMNMGLDIGGASTGEKTNFLIGVALNPTAKNRQLEIQRFKYKMEAGADFAITQPIYDFENYQEFFQELGEVKIPIIMGIWPLVSLRNAEFLKNEVPGVSVPDWVVEEMKKAGDSKEESIKRGIDIAVRTMSMAKNHVAGFQISAPFNKVEIAIEVSRQV